MGFLEGSLNDLCFFAASFLLLGQCRTRLESSGLLSSQCRKRRLLILQHLFCWSVQLHAHLLNSWRMANHCHRTGAISDTEILRDNLFRKVLRSWTTLLVSWQNQVAIICVAREVPGALASGCVLYAGLIIFVR